MLARARDNIRCLRTHLGPLCSELFVVDATFLDAPHYGKNLSWQLQISKMERHISRFRKLETLFPLKGVGMKAIVGLFEHGGVHTAVEKDI